VNSSLTGFRFRRYSHAYYNENQSLISDEDYDALFHELKDLESMFPQHTDKESPTAVVGAKVMMH